MYMNICINLVAQLDARSSKNSAQQRGRGAGLTVDSLLCARRANRGSRLEGSELRPELLGCHVLVGVQRPGGLRPGHFEPGADGLRAQH